MLRILIKKQLLEINSVLFFDRKTGKRRSATGITLFIGLFVLLFAFLIVMFAAMAYAIGNVFLSNGLNWFYFVITGGIGIFFGVFGSVFNTYASLYLAKDNDLLLSMPIPVKSIILSRLASVYIIGAIYAGLVTLPAAVVYMILSGWAVKGIIGSLLVSAAVSVIVFAISCGLGYIVAKLATKLKNKGILTTIITVAFLGAYYAIYFNANDILAKLAANGEAVAGAVKLYVYPLYAMGKVGEGDPIFSVCFIAAVAVLTYLVYLIISRSFLKIATSSAKTKSGKYDGKKTVRKSEFAALFKKELLRFTTSSAYMLNCGIGSLFMIAVGIIALIKGGALAADPEIYEFMSPYLAPIVYASIILFASMNIITAPSISLEGKNIWILKSLPINVKKVFGAKTLLHVVITLPAAEFLTLCLALIFKLGLPVTIISVIICAAFVLLSAMFGLFLNLKRPDFRWTSESVAVKQGFAPMVAIFAGIVFAAAIGAICIALTKVLSAFLIGVIIAAILLVLLAILFGYFNKKAVKDFADL